MAKWLEVPLTWSCVAISRCFFSNLKARTARHLTSEPTGMQMGLRPRGPHCSACLPANPGGRCIVLDLNAPCGRLRRKPAGWHLSPLRRGKEGN